MKHIVDLASISIQHEQFNIAFIGLLLDSKLKHKIKFYGEESHVAVLNKAFPSLSTVHLPVYQKRGSYNEFIRSFIQVGNFFKISRKIAKNDDLVILLIHPFAHFLIKILNPFFFKGNSITIVLHGELEALKFNKHFLNKIWGFFLKVALNWQTNNFKYIVLGKSIYTNLKELIPNIANQEVLILNHPYPFKYISSDRKVDISPLTFCSVGGATIHKNSNLYFELAYQNKDLVMRNKVKFRIGGRVYHDMEKYTNRYVEYKGLNLFYSREEIDEVLQSSHFAIFYYSNYNYSLCSSGAFWDAINSEIPILYVKNDFFDYYASLVGNIGVSFENANLLNSYVYEIIINGIDPLIYAEFIHNVRKIKYDIMNNRLLGEKLIHFLNSNEND